MERNQNTNNTRDTLKKVGIGIGIAGGVIAMIGLIPIAIGFGGAGIVAGSIAAGIQASIGNVAAGSLFALLTSLGMTGTLTVTATVGAIIGGGGLVSYLAAKFCPGKDSELIHEIIKNNDNPDLLMGILNYRKPNQREEIADTFDEMYSDEFFVNKVVSFLPKKHKNHAAFLLSKTEFIYAKNDKVLHFMNNMNLKSYLEMGEDFKRDAILIKMVIENKDFPLIIIRLLEFREVEKTKKIEKEFLKMMGGEKQSLLSYLVDFVPPYEVSFCFALNGKSFYIQPKKK